MLHFEQKSKYGVEYPFKFCYDYIIPRIWSKLWVSYNVYMYFVYTTQPKTLKGHEA